MQYRIGNDKISVEIDSLGGQIRSLKAADGSEYLWQGDEKFWKGQAPNLFPYIGRMTDKSYTYEGTKYHMEIHGFVKVREMTVEDQGEDYIIFRLDSDDETKKSYPFTFSLWIRYHLEESKICIAYEVMNRDEKQMYFGIGGHPGFRVPNQEGVEFTDYYLEFEDGIEPVRVGFSEACFVDGTEEAFELGEGQSLDLHHGMFDDDAIVLKNVGKSVELKCRKGGSSIRLEFPELPYFGIWHTPGKEAPFVCLEPWSSLPSRQDVVEELTTQENLVSLEPGKTYENNWSIGIIR
ncbi:MAG TPA: aldose 1-epimerase family protein [Candidatus Pelethocola excrementipullorum]|nr:aldose 1-epimerase family protein [Candidatus Pelethocola excrementipullorum]